MKSFDIHSWLFGFVCGGIVTLGILVMMGFCYRPPAQVIEIPVFDDVRWQAIQSQWQQERLDWQAAVDNRDALIDYWKSKTPEYQFIRVEITKEVEVIKPVGALATPDELRMVYEHIDYGLYSHQFYAVNTWAQTDITGDTKYNQGKVKSYLKMKELIDRAYGWQKVGAW